MFWKKKQPAWFWKAVIVLIVLRILYTFARFFMKAADKHARGCEKDSNKIR